jgi:hypothetical protein
MDPETQAPEVSTSPAVDSAPPQDTQPSQGGESAGFSSPYEAFSALPEFQGREPLEIARELYRSYTGFQDAQRHLQQYQAVRPELSDWMANKQAYMQWKQSQAPQPQPEQPKKWFAPPEIKEDWRNYIVRDPATGREVIDPNAPFEAQQRLREYQDYTQNFARKLVTDPEGTLKPFIEQVAQAKAEELVQKQFGQHSAETYIQDLERQNADWLYDQQGNISPYGQAIANGIEEAKQLGIATPQGRWQYATNLLKSELLAMRYQQMQGQIQQQVAPPPAAPQNPVSNTATRDINFLRERATRAPNRSAGTTEPRAPQQRISFEERLRQQLERDGVTS